MTTDDKKLLLEDLCSRLPYRVKCLVNTHTEVVDGIIIDDEVINFGFRSFDVEEVKPYLFPLSTITEKEYDLLIKLGYFSNCALQYQFMFRGSDGSKQFKIECIKTFSLDLIRWLNENHIDYRGLIEKGLAIDCTNLNVY